MDNYFLIAEVSTVFDSTGSVVLKSFSDFPERFLKLKSVFIDYFGEKKSLLIELSKIVDKDIVIKFKGINSADDVQFVVGKKLYVDSANLYKLPDDSFYIHDLIGSDVFIGTKFFGKLTDVLTIPANDVYVIEHEGKEVLIPVVQQYIKEFDEHIKKLFLTDLSRMLFDEN